MRPLRAAWRASVVAFGFLVVVGGCSSGSSVSSSAPPLPEPNQERVVYVALGGDETVNRELEDPFRDAWPQRVFTAALPRSAVYVNFGRPGATAADAESDQLPQALALDPTVATVWLGSGDARGGTSEGAFAENLRRVVDELQAAGARVLLLAPDRTDGDGGLYSDVVRQLASETTATYVVVPGGDRRESDVQSAIGNAVAAALAG